MRKANIDNIIYSLSKITIVVPIIIILVALFVFMNRRFAATKTMSNSFISPTSLPVENSSLFNSLLQQNSTNEGKLDLKGPYYCIYGTKTSTISAYIKNLSIYAEQNSLNSQNNFLLNGDCFYIWQKGKFSGEKLCGISQFMPMINMFSNIGISIDNLFNYLPLNDLLKDKQFISKEEIDKFVKSCKKQEIDDLIFEVPRQILFRNKDIGSSSPSPMQFFNQ
jgi:hypothetical protein